MSNCHRPGLSDDVCAKMPRKSRGRMRDCRWAKVHAVVRDRVWYHRRGRVLHQIRREVRAGLQGIANAQYFKSSPSCILWTSILSAPRNGAQPSTRTFVLPSTSTSAKRDTVEARWLQFVIYKNQVKYFQIESLRWVTFGTSPFQHKIVVIL